MILVDSSLWIDHLLAPETSDCWPPVRNWALLRTSHINENNMNLSELLKDSAYKLTQFKPAQIAAEVLLVYLRLPAICELMDLHTSASLYPAISEKDLSGLPIPKISDDVQRKISTLVQQSFTLKAQSERLLEAAKRAVEIAIEQDEAAGMAYLAREGALA